MKRYRVFLSVAVAVVMLSFMTAWAGEPQFPLRKDPSQTSSQTSTFIVTIVKIDVATNYLVVKDGSGKLWEFTLDPKCGIDLRNYKVGETVTATVATAPASGNPEMRARISKAQLIRLQ